MRLTQIVEALLFASDAPLTAADIARIDERLDEDTVDAVVQELRTEYEEAERAFQIYEVAGGYQMLTRPDFATYLERYETIPQPAKLSSSGLEVLAIIAYRQPIGRGEVEEIRGVGSSGSIKTLVDRGLIEVTARGEGLGRPLLYGTTVKFLEHFGFKSLDDLPRPDELPVVLRSRAAVPTVESSGETPSVEEAPPANDGSTAVTQAAVDVSVEDGVSAAIVTEANSGTAEDELVAGADEEFGASADDMAETDADDAFEANAVDAFTAVANDDFEANADEDLAVTEDERSVSDDDAVNDDATAAVENEPGETDAVAQAGPEEEV